MFSTQPLIKYVFIFIIYITNSLSICQLLNQFFFKFTLCVFLGCKFWNQMFAAAVSKITSFKHCYHIFLFDLRYYVKGNWMKWFQIFIMGIINNFWQFFFCVWIGPILRYVIHKLIKLGSIFCSWDPFIICSNLIRKFFNVFLKQNKRILLFKVINNIILCNETTVLPVKFIVW